jgi:CRP-like cAMP-binding protein
VAIRTRGRQRVGVSNDAAEYAYVVRGGVFIITATMPGDRHQILGLLYPGDVIRGSQLPPLQGAAMIAMTATGEVARLKWRQLETLAADDAGIARHLYDRLADQAARQAMHAAVIGSLTGEERVASLLLELANRIGAPVADGLAFDILLSRADIADYLALNADTVSRIISRLRAKGLVSQSGRSRFICHDSEALAQESPVAQALTELCRRDERPPGT